MLDNLTVPVLNRYDLLDRMIASIDYPIRHLLIVDNGASTVMEDVRIDVPDCVELTTYLPMPANLGVAASWNLGIKSFPYDDRWFFASNDVEFVGYEAVRRLGLFDEAFFPAYFEDNDYNTRANHHGVPITKLPVETLHENSATIYANPVFAQKNSATFISIMRTRLLAGILVLGVGMWNGVA